MLFRIYSAVFFLVWYVVITGVALSGFIEIVTKFRRRPRARTTNEVGVTILRPIKGIDPELSSCLESLFLQDYPADKLQILFCVADAHDPSIPIIRELMNRYPHILSRVLVHADHFGPNPKVNNLAKGFVEAEHDVLWVMDLNVWALESILRNLVRALEENENNGKKLDPMAKRQVRLVHHVPLAYSTRDVPVNTLGAQLDEMFLHTSHSKFYVALNNLNIAPCVNGKLNLYRKSDLDYAVQQISQNMDSEFFDTPQVRRDAAYYASLGSGHAIKLFARYIGEDNMIAILLWEGALGRTALTGDVVLQPFGARSNSVRDYTQRRVRWLRVRKYMVLMATLVEPTTELIICGIFGTYGLLVLIFGCTFSWLYFTVHMLAWMATDWVQYNVLVRRDKGPYDPMWLRKFEPPEFPQWLLTWAMRECLALPIWIMAMLGHEIDWRGRPFRIKGDLTAEEL